VKQLSLESNRQITQEEISRMEKDLCKMEYALYEQYCEIGKGFLETAEQENKKINRLVDRIIETHQKLAEAKKEKCCPECAEHNDWDSLYCKRCGEKLPLVDDTKEDEDGTE